MNYFPLVSTIIAAIFAFLLALQWRKRKKPYQLIWMISLVMFFAASLLEFLAEYMYETYIPNVGWSELSYRLYYVLTPSMVALMGAGSLYLLAHMPVGKYFLYFTTAVTIPLFVLGFSVPIGDALSKAVLNKRGTEIGGEAMPSYVRAFSPVLTIPGGLAIIGGAVYSFWLDRARKYNLLIALGGLFPFIGGLRTRFGNPTFFYLLDMIGTILLFGGFVLSLEYRRIREATSTAKAS